MAGVSTRRLTLIRGRDGYYRTSWYDDRLVRWHRKFGRDRRRAENRFHGFHAQWQADARVRNPSMAAPITIAQGWELFAQHADRYYRRADGTPTGEALNITHAMRLVIELFGGGPAEAFGPRALATVRDQMIADDLCLNVINQRVRKIRSVFKWLAAQELIPASVWHGLQTVEALKRGRSDARSTDGVMPVPEAYIWQTCEHLSPVVRAMVHVQYLTGMRPGELCAMRPRDLTTGRPVWLYTPGHHKTAHHGRRRCVLIGPKAQAVLAPFLRRDIEASIWSPREATAARYAACPTHRRVSSPAPATPRRIGDRYTPQAYGRAIAYASRAAAVPHWSPNQLRHNALTRLRREAGLDVAQVVAGHAKASATEIYAELDLARAVAVMERVG